MSRVIKERIKTISIYILIVSGLLQVGILWSYQNQGAPISFLSGLFSNDIHISNEIVRETLFIPDRIIVSDGEYSNSHWIITNKNEYYSGFWKEAFAGLSKIANGNVKFSVSDEHWDEVVEKRGFLIDFGYEVRPELLGWFLGIGDLVNGVPGFRKLMINRDIISDDKGTFYIYGTDGAVYCSEPIRYDQAVNLANTLSNLYDNEYQINRRYYSLSGSKIQKAEDEPDVLYVAVSPRYWTYPVLLVEPPVEAKINEDFEDIILGSDAGRYNKYAYNGNITQFTYGSNIYRYYIDGYFTYRYLGGTENNSTISVEEALMNAYQFVARVKELYDSEADIVLTSVEKRAGGLYKIAFDYRIDGMPVKVEYDMKNGSGGKLRHAISILADSERVLECDCLITNLETIKIGMYNDRALELMGREKILFDNINIQQMDVGYYINDNNKNSLEPALMIETKNEDMIYLDLQPEEGD